MICPNCNSNIINGLTVCPNCGSQLDSNPSNELINVQQETPSNEFINVQESSDTTNMVQPNTNINQNNNQFNQGMECPNCHNKVEPGRKFCNNCGTRLNDDTFDQTQLNKAVPMATSESNKRSVENYYNYYFNNKYEQVKHSGFSIGVFFFSYFWLFFYKLYSEALRLFLTTFVVGLVGGLGSFIATMVGINPYLIVVGVFVIDLMITISYARDFSFLRIQKAKHEIEEILNSYVSEEDTIARCKSAGTPHKTLMTIFLILYALGFAGLIFGIIALVGMGLFVVSNMESYSVTHARTYIDSVDKKIMNKELKVKNGNITMGNNYYVLIDSSKMNLIEYPLDIENAAGDKGYIIIDYTNSDIKYYICLSGYNGNNKYFISDYSDNLSNAKESNYGTCNVNDKIAGTNAQRLYGR